MKQETLIGCELVRIKVQITVSSVTIAAFDIEKESHKVAAKLAVCRKAFFFVGSGAAVTSINIDNH